MKKFLSGIVFLFIFTQSVSAFTFSEIKSESFFNSDIRAIKSILKSQVRYANGGNFEKYISIFSDDYYNDDGFNLEDYSNLIKDIWDSYGKIHYGIKIKDVKINGENASVNAEETSYGSVFYNGHVKGVLESKSNCVYYLKKSGRKWKVYSDNVLNETTSLLYADAQNLDIKLEAPEKVKPGEEYCAVLEFTPPEGIIAIASIANKKVEFPQGMPEEVFRRLPEDNILERLFVSNSENLNEFVLASIALTEADISPEKFNVKLKGFGYKIVRVKVEKKSEDTDCAQDK